MRGLYHANGLYYWNARVQGMTLAVSGVWLGTLAPYTCSLFPGPHGVQLCESTGCPKQGLVHRDANASWNIALASGLTDLLGVCDRAKSNLILSVL